ncbi:MAG: hypothetical protein IT208_01350 [Chthonomonadales bacterium]|nr:hypothetical protein [Chthonomonadales bacterium]
MSETRALIVAAACLWLPLALALARRLTSAAGLRRANFRGETIPTALGSAVLLWSVPALAALSAIIPQRRDELAAFAWVLCAFGALGLADDRAADRAAKGLHGHVRRLVRDRAVTTGLLKAAGGLATGVLVPWLVLRLDAADVAIDALLIALSANALNLLDLRPGRATAAFLLGAAALCATEAAQSALGRVPAILLVAVPVLPVYERDARARAMLGDTGANALGGALGLACALALPWPPARVGVVIMLLALHLAAERWSLSAIIERCALLRALDRLTGVR